jgi:hypothetical protein
MSCSASALLDLLFCPGLALSKLLVIANPISGDGVLDCGLGTLSGVAICA